MVDCLIQHLLVEYVPDHLLKMQETCNEIMRMMPAAFQLVPDCFKTQEMCIRGVEVDPWKFKFVPDHFKTYKVCDDGVRYYPCSLQFVPDWLVIWEWIGL